MVNVIIMTAVLVAHSAVAPIIPKHHPKGYWISARRKEHSAWLVHDAYVFPRKMTVGTAGKGHFTRSGFLKVGEILRHPIWHPTKYERAMWKRAGNPLPKGDIKYGSPRYPFGEYYLSLGVDSLACHGGLRLTSNEGLDTCGCVQFFDTDIIWLLHHGITRQSLVYYGP